MPESPLLFSSLVPTCGFCLQVQSRSRGVGDPKPTSTVARGPHAGRWRRALQRLDSSTYRLQNRGNKARMFMKTKNKVKKSSSRRSWGGEANLRRHLSTSPPISGRGGSRTAPTSTAQISGNKARMSMKTKDNAKISAWLGCSGLSSSPMV